MRLKILKTILLIMTFSCLAHADYWVFTCEQGGNKIIFTQKSETSEAKIEFTSGENSGQNNFSQTGCDLLVEESCENFTVSGYLNEHIKFSRFKINFVKPKSAEPIVTDLNLWDKENMPLMGMPYQCSVERKN